MSAGIPNERDIARAKELARDIPPSECSFCHDQPVQDAASWLDGKPRPPAPCPRCGKVTPASEDWEQSLPDDVYDELVPRGFE